MSKRNFPGTDNSTLPQQGAGARGARVLKLAAGMAGRSVLGRLGAVLPKSVGAPNPLAEEMLRTLGELKGGYMKLGQILSYVDSELPEEVRKRLQALCLTGTAVEWKVVASVIESEFGKPAQEVFPGISQEPVASASIGQVHRATLPEVGAVAVKVQYPGISSVVDQDIKGLSMVGGVLGALTAIEPDVVLGEMQARFQEECDYSREAFNQETFWLLARQTPGLRIPRPIAGKSTARVLCTEWVEGRKFDELLATGSPDSKHEVGLRLFRFTYELILRYGLFNADPHPGNFLVGQGGELVMLDFGCVKRFPPPFVDGWKRLLRALDAASPRAVREAVMDSGMVANERRFDFEYFHRMLDVLYQPFLSREPFQFTSEYIRRCNKLQSDGNPNVRHTRLPADWVFFNRLQWGMNSLMAQLGTRHVFRDLCEPLIHEATSTLDEQKLRSEPLSVG